VGICDLNYYYGGYQLPVQTALRQSWDRVVRDGQDQSIRVHEVETDLLISISDELMGSSVWKRPQLRQRCCLAQFVQSRAKAARHLKAERANHLIPG